MNEEQNTTGRRPPTPNLQNIPIRTPEGQRIREAFTNRVCGRSPFTQGATCGRCGVKPGESCPERL